MSRNDRGREWPPMLAAGAMLLLTLTARLTAQDSPVRPLRTAPEVVADLVSERPQLVAWAAHDARRLGDVGLTAPLRQALRAQPADDDPLAPFVALFVLDALAGLGAKVPAAELLPWLDAEHAGPVACLLLARQPLVHEAELFELFRASWPPPTPDWRSLADRERAGLRAQALGNLLCAQQTPGLAAFLLPHTDFDLRATVITAGWRGGGGTIRWEHSLPTEPLPADLPPLPVYSWLRTDRPGRTVCEWVAPGPIEVGIARRQLDQEPPVARSPSRGTADADVATALPWLLALAGARPVPAATVTVEFTDSYRRELTAARAARREFRDRLLQDLVAGRLLEAAAAAPFAALPIQVHITDRRQDQTVPLPDLPSPQ